MKIVKQSAQFERPIDGDEVITFLERCGRTAYKSADRITPDSAAKFVKMIVDRGHLTVIEHASASVRFVCDRGVSHEIVRHRLATYTQESTRFCNYGKTSEIVVIEPPGLTGRARIEWNESCARAETAYLEMLKNGCTPQIARSVLPNSLKTELVMTANLREWHWFFEKRCDPAAHPQMREIALMALSLFKQTIPIVFDDLHFADEIAA